MFTFRNRNILYLLTTEHIKLLNVEPCFFSEFKTHRHFLGNLMFCKIKVLKDEQDTRVIRLVH